MKKENENAARLLILDTDKKFCEHLKIGLNKKGFFTVTASTFSEAVSKVENQEFTVIISEYYLGNRRILDLIQWVKYRSKLNRKTPFFMITANLERMQIEVVKRHISGAILKPFLLSDLTARLEAKKLIPQPENLSQ